MPQFFVDFMALDTFDIDLDLRWIPADPASDDSNVPAEEDVYA